MIYCRQTLFIAGKCYLLQAIIIKQGSSKKRGLVCNDFVDKDKLSQMMMPKVSCCVLQYSKRQMKKQRRESIP
jgi:hypothetical protein